jgi:hypothetical protein
MTKIEINLDTDKVVPILSILFVAGLVVFSSLGGSLRKAPSELTDEDLTVIVVSKEGVELPVRWGDLGNRLVEKGVIDGVKFEGIYAQRGGMTEENKALLYSVNNGKIKINKENSNFVLNLLWAFGLANKSPVLENGPMVDKKYGGAENFASTGGWSLAKGKAMDHYSKYELVKLTPEQEQLVEKVSQNIFRPCCGNSTYFPDCNHGMAMLGLLELMAAQGVTEKEMYKAALAVNAYWFPDTYITLAKYFAKRDIAWKNVDPQEVLGSAYSSASGYRKILEEVDPPKNAGGGGCGV